MMAKKNNVHKQPQIDKKKRPLRYKKQQGNAKDHKELIYSHKETKITVFSFY